MAKRIRNPLAGGGRLLKLTGMTTSIATRVATHQVKSWFQDDALRETNREALMRHIGKEVAATLGEMKGAVMKVGQIASQMQDILPKEISEQLAVLQNASAPMPFHVIRRQLETHLGGKLADHFSEFSETPFAAASIGQVHDAITRDGESVVVKVQYPAVRSSIDSDMRHLKRILRLGSLLKVNEAALDSVFQEIRSRLNEELDYHQEARNLNHLREFHRDQPWLVTPRVHASLSGEAVLTLSREDGVPLHQVNDENGFDQPLRNLLGERLFDALAAEIFQLGTVHCDPHPGNFAFRRDGSIVMYDFGAVKQLSEEDIELFGKVINAATKGDWEHLDAGLIELGARRPDSHPPPGFYDRWVPLILSGFSPEPVNFADARVHLDIVETVRKTPLSALLTFQPSSRTLLVERVVSGHYWTMKALGVHSAFLPRLQSSMAMSKVG